MLHIASRSVVEMKMSQSKTLNQQVNEHSPNSDSSCKETTMTTQENNEETGDNNNCLDAEDNAEMDSNSQNLDSKEKLANDEYGDSVEQVADKTGHNKRQYSTSFSIDALVGRKSNTTANNATSTSSEPTTGKPMLDLWNYQMEELKRIQQLYYQKLYNESYSLKHFATNNHNNNNSNNNNNNNIEYPYLNGNTCDLSRYIPDLSAVQHEHLLAYYTNLLQHSYQDHYMDSLKNYSNVKNVMNSILNNNNNNNNKFAPLAKESTSNNNLESAKHRYVFEGNENKRPMIGKNDCSSSQRSPKNNINSITENKDDDHNHFNDNDNEYLMDEEEDIKLSPNSSTTNSSSTTIINASNSIDGNIDPSRTNYIVDNLLFNNNSSNQSDNSHYSHSNTHVHHRAMNGHNYYPTSTSASSSHHHYCDYETLKSKVSHHSAATTLSTSTLSQTSTGSALSNPNGDNLPSSSQPLTIHSPSSATPLNKNNNNNNSSASPAETSNASNSPNSAAAVAAAFHFSNMFRKPKRIRTAFSPGQLLRLEEIFEKNRYVVGCERKQLARDLNLSETQIKVWFQNRRTKHKREKHVGSSSHHHHGHHSSPATGSSSSSASSTNPLLLFRDAATVAAAAAAVAAGPYGPMDESMEKKLYNSIRSSGIRIDGNCSPKSFLTNGTISSLLSNSSASSSTSGAPLISSSAMGRNAISSGGGGFNFKSSTPTLLAK